MRKADALQAVNVVEPGKQVGQVVAVVPVVAVGIYRLAEDGNLADTAGGQQLHLVGDVVHRAAHLPAPAVRDDAEGTHQITAVDDRHVGCHVGLLRRQRADAALPVPAQPFAHQLQQRFKLLGTQEQVNMGEAALQLFGARADHAAGEGQHRVGPLFTQRLGQVQGAGNFVLGALPDDAGIEHHHVGVGGARRRAEAQLLQRRPQAFGVGGVHLAANSPDVIGLHSASVPCSQGGARGKCRPGDCWRREWDSNPRSRFPRISA